MIKAMEMAELLQSSTEDCLVKVRYLDGETFSLYFGPAYQLSTILRRRPINEANYVVSNIGVGQNECLSIVLQEIQPIEDKVEREFIEAFKRSMEAKK